MLCGPHEDKEKLSKKFKDTYKTTRRKTGCIDAYDKERYPEDENPIIPDLIPPLGPFAKSAEERQLAQIETYAKLKKLADAYDKVAKEARTRRGPNVVVDDETKPTFAILRNRRNTEAIASAFVDDEEYIIMRMKKRNGDGYFMFMAKMRFLGMPPNNTLTYKDHTDGPWRLVDIEVRELLDKKAPEYWNTYDTSDFGPRRGDWTERYKRNFVAECAIEGAAGKKEAKEYKREEHYVFFTWLNDVLVEDEYRGIGLCKRIFLYCQKFWMWKWKLYKQYLKDTGKCGEETCYNYPPMRIEVKSRHPVQAVNCYTAVMNTCNYFETRLSRRERGRHNVLDILEERFTAKVYQKFLQDLHKDLDEFSKNMSNDELKKHVKQVTDAAQEIIGFHGKKQMKGDTKTRPRLPKYDANNKPIPNTRARLKDNYAVLEKDEDFDEAFKYYGDVREAARLELGTGWRKDFWFRYGPPAETYYDQHWDNFGQDYEDTRILRGPKRTVDPDIDVYEPWEDRPDGLKAQLKQRQNRHPDLNKGPYNLVERNIVNRGFERKWCKYTKGGKEAKDCEKGGKRTREEEYAINRAEKEGERISEVEEVDKDGGHSTIIRLSIPKERQQELQRRGFYTPPTTTTTTTTTTAPPGHYHDDDDDSSDSSGYQIQQAQVRSKRRASDGFSAGPNKPRKKRRGDESIPEKTMAFLENVYRKIEQSDISSDVAGRLIDKMDAAIVTLARELETYSIKLARAQHRRRMAKWGMSRQQADATRYPVAIEESCENVITGIERRDVKDLIRDSQEARDDYSEYVPEHSW